MRRFALLLAALVLTGCATSPTLSLPPTTQLLLLGEQHDAPAHQEWERDTVQQLAIRQQLAAVVMEMAEAGRSTAGLPATASEAQARTALAWDDAAWPWAKYGPVAMAAVRAGVPVLGGNLPRAQMRQAMQDTRFDTHLPPAALQRQYEALRTGHCGLLPEAQIAPMARIQLARDASLARTAEAALQPGKTVVLVAGLGHVQRSLGVPTWLPPHLEPKVAIAQAGQSLPAIEKEADWIHHTPALPPQDPCAELRKRFAPGG